MNQNATEHPPRRLRDTLCVSHAAFWSGEASRGHPRPPRAAVAAQRTVELAFSTWNIFELENVKWWADDSLRGALFFKHSVNEHRILGPGATRSGQRHGPCLPALWTVSRNLRAPAAPAPRSRLPVPCALGLPPGTVGCLGSDSPPPPDTASGPLLRGLTD